MDQARLLQLLFGSLSLLKAKSIPLPALLGHEPESTTQWAISKLRPHEPHPLVHYQTCFYMGRCCSVHNTCPLSGIQRLSAIQEQKMYCIYGNSSWYIHGGPLYGGGPLLGGSVIRGSTVFSKLLILSCTRGVHISHLYSNFMIKTK